MSQVFQGAVGKPKRAFLLLEEGTDGEVREVCRRQLADGGFEAFECEAPAGVSARSLETLSAVAGSMAEAHITNDDLMVVVGDVDVLSLASYLCVQWCSGMPLAAIPTSQRALVDATVTPRGIDVAGRSELLSLRPAIKYAFFDIDLVSLDEVGEDALMSRVLMAVSAMCDSESAFSRLWDASEKLCACDHETLCEQLKDTVKTRGKILSSTAIALRQSIVYGSAFASALERLVPGIAPSCARAEALRFQARLACGEGQFEVDDVLAQDELLERLELPTLQATIDPDALVAAVREECFARSNRFLLALPRKLGRVRLAAVSDKLLAEHAAAWCASRA